MSSSNNNTKRPQEPQSGRRRPMQTRHTTSRSVDCPPRTRTEPSRPARPKAPREVEHLSINDEEVDTTGKTERAPDKKQAGTQAGQLGQQSADLERSGRAAGEQPLTRNLVWAVLASALGASFQHGYNGGVINAPEKLIGQFVNRTWTRRHAGQPASEAQVDLVLALIVSVFCVGGAAGASLTAWVAERVGRKQGLFYNNFLVLLASLLEMSASSLASYELLIAGRFIIGLNAGLSAGLTPLYLNEIAPRRLRGALGTVYQLVITVSIFLSNVLGMPALLGSEAGWPMLFAVPLLPAIFMMFALPHCPESPKHLLLNEARELQAQQALAWLRQTADVQLEMEELKSEHELACNSPSGQVKVRARDLWEQSQFRRPMTISVVIMLSQQLSGINAILFFSTNIFRSAGLSQSAAVEATLGMGLLNVLTTVGSLFLIERAGRRTLHLTGLLGMAANCLLLAACLGFESAPSSNSPLASLLAVLAVYLFIVMFASGPGSIPWFIVAELFPSNARPLASSIAVTVNWLANFMVSLCFLPLSNLLHGYTFLLFALFLLLAAAFTYRNVPETKGATPEEISVLFHQN